MNIIQFSYRYCYLWWINKNIKTVYIFLMNDIIMVVIYLRNENNNYRIVLFTTKSQKKYTDYSFQENDILLFGRESAGVPKYVHQSVNEQLTIPMVKGLRSINVSSSVAIVAGEACRQLNQL